MQTYDFLMLIVLAACTIFGFYKGMAWQIASIASLALSYFVALNFSDKLAPHISAEPPLNRIAAMLALYLGTSLVVWIVFRGVAGAIDKIKLKDFDRQIGGLFGACKGVLLCLVITFFAVTLSERARDTIVHSRSGYYISRLIEKADPILPEGVHDIIGPYLHQLDEELQAGAAGSWGGSEDLHFNSGGTGDIEYPDADPRSAQSPWGGIRQDWQEAVDTAERFQRAADAYRQ